MFLGFRFCDNDVTIFHVELRESIESFVVEGFGGLFWWYPYVIFQYFLFLQGQRVYLFYQTEELVFQKFWALLVAVDDVEDLFGQIFVFFHHVLVQLFKIVPQSELLVCLTDTHFNILDCLILEQSIEKSLLFFFLLFAILILRKFLDHLPLIGNILRRSDQRLQFLKLVRFLIFFQFVQMREELLKNNLVCIKLVVVTGNSFQVSDHAVSEPLILVGFYQHSLLEDGAQLFPYLVFLEILLCEQGHYLIGVMDICKFSIGECFYYLVSDNILVFCGLLLRIYFYPLFQFYLLLDIVHSVFERMSWLAEMFFGHQGSDEFVFGVFLGEVFQLGAMGFGF